MLSFRIVAVCLLATIFGCTPPPADRRVEETPREGGAQRGAAAAPAGEPFMGLTRSEYAEVGDLVLTLFAGVRVQDRSGRATPGAPAHGTREVERGDLTQEGEPELVVRKNGRIRHLHISVSEGRDGSDLVVVESEIASPDGTTHVERREAVFEVDAEGKQSLRWLAEPHAVP